MNPEQVNPSPLNAAPADTKKTATQSRAFDVEAVALQGTQLVEASAGTGKTYAISTLVVRLLLETDWSIDRLLVVTFTEAATAELRDRVRRRVKEALAALNATTASDESDLGRLLRKQPRALAQGKLERALRDFDSAAIFTIHGFCQRALQENAFASGVLFNAELLRDPRPLLEEIVLDFWAREVGPASSVFVEYLRDQNITPKQLQPLAGLTAQTLLLQVVPREVFSEATARQAAAQQAAVPPQGAAMAREPARASFGLIDTARLERAVAQACELFDETKVLRLLHDSDLNGNKYQRRYLPKWVRELRIMFEQGRHLPRLPEMFHKFCTPALLAASRSGTVPDHAFFAACDELNEAIAEVQTRLEPERQRLFAALVARLNHEFGERKREAGALTFDDLLHGVYRALAGPRGAELGRSLRERFPAALIDEFQDTDPVQYSIFKRIYVGRSNPLFLIGDPKQAIYSFRGADVFAYLGAVSTVASDVRHTMKTNYRSDAALVQAVNTLFQTASCPFFLNELDYVEVEARADGGVAPSFPEPIGSEPLIFRFIPRPNKNARPADGAAAAYSFDKFFKTRTLPDQVAVEIAELLASGVQIAGKPLSPRHIAVLTRTNAQAFDCQRALQRLRVPSVVLGDRSVFEYDEAHELQLFLAAVLEPQNPRALRAALTTELVGLTIKTLLAAEEDEALWDQWVDRFRNYNQRWTSDGFVQMFRLAMEECGISDHLLGLPDGERRMTNLLHLVELLHVEATAQHLGPSGLFHHLSEQRARVFAQQDNEQIRLESDEDAVTLTTIHKSKGLEYAIVLCPFLFADFLVLPSERWTVRFHDNERERALTLDLGSEQHAEHLALMEDEALAENLRLLYVALTRAKHRCVVFWGAVPGFEASALGYLLHSRDVRSLLGEPNRQQVALHIKSLSDEALLERLTELHQTTPSVGFSSVDFGATAPAFRPSTQASEKLLARQVKTALTRWERTASFTELSHHTANPLLGATEGRDHDEALRPPRPTAEPRVRVRLADFPGGANAGNFFHAVLEHWDFTEPLPDALLQAQLRAHGLPKDELLGVAKEALLQCVRTPLQAGLRLADVPGSARRNELEFFLAANANATFSSSRDATATPLLPRMLARIFAEHPSPELPPHYATEVSALHFMPLRGYLKGFIDLVFFHDGKWWLADYKSNRLGDHYDDYGKEALARSMTENHYFLQYHLYAVALHRCLLLRQADYDYDRDFGGVYYLFLRGMHPEQSSGIFYEKPPRARIEALSALFAATGEQA